MSDHAGLGTAAVTGAFWSSAGGLLSHTASIGLTIVIARYVGPTNYGLVAIAIACLALLQSLLENTFSDALVRLPTLQNDYCNVVFWLELGVAVLLLSAVVVLAPVVALIVHQPQVTRLLQALAPLTLLTALTAVPAALLTRDLNYRALFFRSVLAVIGGGLLGAVMAIAGYGPWSLVVQQLARWTIQGIILWIASDWRPSFALSPAHLREMWAYGIRMCGLQLVDFLMPQGARLVIAAILGPTALGLYDVAARFCLFIEIILIHPLGVLFPTVAKIQNSLPAIQRLNIEAMRTAAIITVPAFVGLACVAPSLIPMLLGDAWADAVGTMQILCVATFFNLFIAIYAPTLLALGMPGWQFVVNAVMTTATLLLLPVLARLGLPFAATAVAIAAGLGWPLQLLVVRYTTHMDVIKQQVVIVPALIGSAIMAFAVLVYHNALKTVVDEPFLLATEILIGIVVYVCLMLILQRSFVLGLAARVRSVFLHRKTLLRAGKLCA
jgi:O-antigen/teichoic acid export membrane protein